MASSVASYEQHKDPWKYKGYPEFTKCMASSNDFFVVRRFTQLGARALLLLQDDLTKIEENLRECDQFAREQPDGFGGSGSFRMDQKEESPRELALRKAIKKLQQYYDLLNALSELKSRPGAQSHQVQNVRNWLEEHYGAIAQNEQSFIKRDGDLVTLVSKKHSLLQQSLERVQGVQNLFRLGHREDRVESESTVYFSERWFETCTSATIVVVGLIMLFVPMWCLDSVESSYKRLGIITGFGILFSVLLFGTTTSSAKGFEVLAATAAYAAVLSVFLQSNGPTSGTD